MNSPTAEFETDRPNPPRLANTPTEILVIGCGNILRGDDAVGPVLIRRLWDRGVPDHVRCADGGTGGMDVAFQMRGVPHVILIDASNSGNEPGSLYELPGHEVEQLPPLTGINLHAFRWDHALAFARWLLKDEYPQRVTVYLIEGQSFRVGDPLSQRVDAAVNQLAERLALQWQTPSNQVALEFGADGYLRISRDDARRYFPDDVLVPLKRDGRLLLLPTRGAAAGGLMLKQRNPAGDRSLLLSETFQFQMPCGRFVAHWNEALGGLELVLPGLEN